MARHPDPADNAVPPRVPEVPDHPAGGGESLPLLRPLDVVEGEYVDVVGPEGREDRPQLRRGVGRRPRAELGADDDRRPVRAERGDGRGEGVAVGRPLGEALPVEEVHAAADRREHVVRSDRRLAVGREAEPADGAAERRR